MNKRQHLRGAIRFALGAATGLTAALVAPAALAQGAAEQRMDEVVVTGSRIARSGDLDSPTPLITIDREEIAKSGYQNLQQLMEKMPVNGNGAFSTRGNNQDSSANGGASVSLRGLGADATLVLVNGRRVAISSFAENITNNFVDINTIPVAAIERLEVLKDGASAVYGSDAIAGVINVVLRKDFDGFEVSAGYGDVTSGSNAETTASAIWGTSGEDSNITIVFDYFKNDTLYNRERGYLGTANQSPRGGGDNRSSRGFPGRFFVNDGVITPPATTDREIRRDPACPAGSAVGTRPSESCLYDYGPWNLLIPASERSGLMLLGHKGFGDNFELFTEIAVQHNRSVAQGAPTPLDETAGLTIPNNHPNNPFTGSTAIAVSRYRTVDAGARQWDIETDNLRAVVGLRGEVGDWQWETAMQRARSESLQTGDRSMGWVRTDFLQVALNNFSYNPFGGTFNPQSVIDTITTSLVRQGNSELTMFDASITGPLFDMPAGKARMAAGVEYREEDISDIPDDQFQRGLIFGTEAVAAAAARDNWSAFLEFAFPLHQTLELQVAGRYDDYSDFGTTFNPKVALRWTPMDALALRASWGTGFRAPSLAQIGLGPSRESVFFVDTFGCAINAAYCASTDYQIEFSGNPDLEAEESDNFNIGAVWRPTDAFSVSLDYWDIKQEKKIDQVPRQFIYDRNCNNQASTVCVRGTPLPGQTLGPLQLIFSSFVNISEQSASGIDLAAFYNMPLGAGSLTLGLDYSRLLEFDRIQLNSAGTAFITRALAGEYEYPEDRWALTGDWQVGDWGIFGRLTSIGEFEDFGTNVAARQRTIKAFTTLNLQVSYSGFANTKIALSVDNALDEFPPFAIGDGDADLYGYVSQTHSPRGRFWNMRATYAF